MATADLHLLLILLNHLRLRKGEETGIGRIGNKVAGLSQRIEGVDAGSIGAGGLRNGRGHGALGGQGVLRRGERLLLLGRKLIDTV